MRDYLTIGSTPCDEDCAQVGSDDYHKRMRIESAAFIAQLRRQFGNEPQGAELRVKFFSHDYGTYHEVVCYYDDTLPESVEYAYKLESETPENWDIEALKYLAGYLTCENGELCSTRKDCYCNNCKKYRAQA